MKSVEISSQRSPEAITAEEDRDKAPPVGPMVSSNHHEDPDPYASAFSVQAKELAESSARLVRRADAYGTYRMDSKEGLVATTTKETLGVGELVRHFRGEQAPVGAHLVDSADTVEWMVFDVDRHPKPDGTFDRPEQAVFEDAATLFHGLIALDLNPVLERSCPNGSSKVWLFLDGPIPASTARRFGQWFVRGFAQPIEAFPKQDSVWSEDKSSGARELGFGNWVRLPGRHHRYREYWSRLWDSGTDDWATPKNTVEIWLARRSSSASVLIELAERAAAPAPEGAMVSAPCESGSARGSTDPESLRNRVDPYLEAVVSGTRGSGPGTGRADTLYRVAAKFAVDWALPDEFVLDSLHKVNNNFGARYPESNLRDTLTNAHRYGKGAYGNDLASRLPERDAVSSTSPQGATSASSDGADASKSTAIKFLAADRGYRDLMDDVSERPPSILGDGLLYPRQIGQLHGTDGSRKSWALLFLVVAAATGMEWFGLKTRHGGMRVGLISLEDDVWLLQERLRQIVLAMGADEALLQRNLRVIYPPYFDHRLNLLNGEDRAAVVTWIKHHGFDLVVIDHLSRTHELDPKDLHLASAQALSIARECTCGVVFAHHDRKRAQGTRGRDSDAFLGSALFRADCRLSMHIYEVEEDLLCITFEKSTGRRKPAPIWFRQVEEKGGVLEVTTAPKKAGDRKKANKARLLDLIREAGPDGIAPRLLVGLFEVAMDTLGGYAKELEQEGKIERRGRTDSTRWIALELPDDKTRPEDGR